MPNHTYAAAGQGIGLGLMGKRRMIKCMVMETH